MKTLVDRLQGRVVPSKGERRGQCTESYQRLVLYRPQLRQLPQHQALIASALVGFRHAKRTMLATTVGALLRRKLGSESVKTYFLMAMNSHACLSGVSLVDMYLMGYISHRIRISLGIYLTKCVLHWACISWACTSLGIYLIGMYLMGVYLIGIYLMGVHLMGIYLMGVYLMGVYLMGVHLTGYTLHRCVSHGRVPHRRILHWVYTSCVYTL
jgi:hypothetical protein